MSAVTFEQAAETTYRFLPQSRCDMCGSAEFKTLGIRLNRRQGFRPRPLSGVAVSVKRCSSCELVYADPMPLPAQVEDHYDLDPADYFDEDLHHPEPAVDPVVSRLVGFTRRMKLLDIGAGLGRSMTAFADQGWDVWGIEPSPSFHRAAIERFGIRADRIALATVEEAEFAPESFDFISFGAVLEHLYSPSLALARAIRWLRPGGVMYVEVPSSRYLINRLLALYYRGIGLNYVSNISPMHPPFHLYEFSHRSFEANGEQSGYKVSEFRYWAGENPMIPRALNPSFHRLMEMTGRGMQLSVYLQRQN
ncbi:MAG TPA: methyltransferase domain-containing protein [Sphingomicrobium sp.]